MEEIVYTTKEIHELTIDALARGEKFPIIIIPAPGKGKRIVIRDEE